MGCLSVWCSCSDGGYDTHLLKCKFLPLYRDCPLNIPISLRYLHQLRIRYEHVSLDWEAGKYERILRSNIARAFGWAQDVLVYLLICSYRFFCSHIFIFDLFSSVSALLFSRLVWFLTSESFTVFDMSLRIENCYWDAADCSKEWIEIKREINVLGTQCCSSRTHCIFHCASFVSSCIEQS